MAGGWEESAVGLLIWLSRDPDGTAQVGSWISLTEKKAEDQNLKHISIASQ